MVAGRLPATDHVPRFPIRTKLCATHGKRRCRREVGNAPAFERIGCCAQAAATKPTMQVPRERVAVRQAEERLVEILGAPGLAKDARFVVRPVTVVSGMRVSGCKVTASFWSGRG